MAFAERDTSRDQYRHPMETLAFFGITPQMDVLEISPGGGWYTELLADYVTGNLLAGHYDPQSDRAYYRNSQGKFVAKIEASPELYGNVKMHIFDAAAKKQFLGVMLLLFRLDKSLVKFKKYASTEIILFWF